MRTTFENGDLVVYRIISELDIRMPGEPLTCVPYVFVGRYDGAMPTEKPDMLFDVMVKCCGRCSFVKTLDLSLFKACYGPISFSLSRPSSPARHLKEAYDEHLKQTLGL